MVATNAILLPKVLATDLVSLGQLVRNPLIPHTNSYLEGCSIVKTDDVSDETLEEPYDTIVSTNVNGRFDIGLTKLLGLNIGGKKTSLLSIKAKKLQLRALKNVDGIFRQICEKETAKKWINDMVLYKMPCYIVIGLQILHGAEFNRAILKAGAAGGYALVPLEATTSIPLKITGKIDASSFGKSDGKNVTGVFGIEVQRVDHHLVAASQMALKPDISWKWTYQRVKGNQQEQTSQLLSVSLADVEVSELTALLEKDERDAEDEQDTDEESQGAGTDGRND